MKVASTGFTNWYIPQDLIFTLLINHYQKIYNQSLVATGQSKKKINKIRSKTNPQVENTWYPVSNLATSPNLSLLTATQNIF